MREWLVASALIESGSDLLLVRNSRVGGYEDWSTPGGVIDAQDSNVLTGLTREVREETGLLVLAWDGPVYEVSAEAIDMDWRLRVEVHRAVDYEGELRVDDPDGIVVEAAFLAPEECSERFSEMAPWVREPLAEWLAQRWDARVRRGYHYEVHGTDRRSLRVVRSS
jgi:8-oxo-dGTP diphosphatase